MHTIHYGADSDGTVLHGPSLGSTQGAFLYQEERRRCRRRYACRRFICLLSLPSSSSSSLPLMPIRCTPSWCMVACPDDMCGERRQHVRLFPLKTGCCLLKCGVSTHITVAHCSSYLFRRSGAAERWKGGGGGGERERYIILVRF